MCVENINEGVDSPEKCSNGGYKEDKGISFLEPSLEFQPTYLGKSNFGLSYFFALNKSENTLLDYPVEGEKSDIEIDRISINPIIYYNLGDKFIKNGKGLSTRLGVGGALSYVYNFKIVRQSTQESIIEENELRTGWAIFLEFNWKWFSFKVENSQTLYHGIKFEDIESERLKIENNKASLMFSYYL